MSKDWLRRPFQLLGFFESDVPTGPRIALAMEQLEDRSVPASYQWNATSQALASDPAAWLRSGVPTTVPPGPLDDLIFTGKRGGCVLNIPSVRNFALLADFEAAVRIPVDGIVENATGKFTVTGDFLMTGGRFDVHPAGRGELTIASPGKFEWSKGTIANTDVILGSAAARGVTVSIKGGDNTVLESSTITNFATESMIEGWVKVTFGQCSIINEAGATFEATNSFNFRDVTVRNVGSVTNRGTWKFTGAGAARLDADFLNDGGTVRIKTGTAQFAYKAEQTLGTFEFDGGTAKMGLAVGHAPLSIYQGLITGSGTIDGNLILGVDGGGPTPVTIQPGLDGGVGTLTVKESYQVFSDCALTAIKLVDASNYSRIDVQGAWAILNGLLHVEKDAGFKPGVIPPIPFFTSATSLAGDFVVGGTTITNSTWNVGGDPFEMYAEKVGTNYVLKVRPGGLPPPPPPSP